MKKLKPMLAHIGTTRDLKLTGWIYEPKLDGTRALLFKKGKKVRILNRRGLWIEYRYPEIVEEAKQLKGSFILDGEICVLGQKGKPDFHALQTREQTENRLRIKFLSRQFPAVFYAFDILKLGEKDLTSQPLIKRKEVLNQIVKGGQHIRLVFWTKDGAGLWRRIKKLGMEGVMAKQLNSKYLLSKRSKDWLKIKTTKTLDAVICGYTQGEGARAKTFASLILGIYKKGKLVYIGRVGTGFDEQTQKLLLRKMKPLLRKTSPFSEEVRAPRKIFWLKPKLLAEVKYLEFTKSGQLRAPVFLRLREDKPLNILF